MRQFFQKAMREQLQKSLDNPSELIKDPVPKIGWIKIIRQALGMTNCQLAQRLGCTQSNVVALESSEKNGTISLKNLERVAEAMNCHVVYFLVPEKSLDHIREAQARAIAKKRLKTVGHSMALEQQALTLDQTKSQEDALVIELLQGNPKDLWEE
ncbi:MAG: mobile mystery protein A [Candidatus Babeliales bacterium]|jgi:predicted DNA-binding mobile mystery protein A